MASRGEQLNPVFNMETSLSESTIELIDKVEEVFDGLVDITNGITSMTVTIFEEQPAKLDSIAFAFDIDGVLVRGKQALEGASKALQTLRDNNIPFIVLTNGGGKTEVEHAALLTERLGITISDRQFVQSHTPFRALLPRYRDKTVLVLGGHSDNIRQIAYEYGFLNVVTSSDILKEWEHIHPFPEMTRPHHDTHGRRRDTISKLQVSAIMIFSSPRDWCLDLQVVTDLLLSQGGVLDTRSELNGNPDLKNCGYQQDGQPVLYFCNPDFEWATAHHHPRFAQGAFREALKGVWNYATDGKAELLYEECGKPTKTTYEYAEEVLWKFHCEEALSTAKPIKTVYMIGDNPESDIRGANAHVSKHGAEWKSVLVQSGVYVAGTEPAHKPDYCVAGVGEAVALVLEKEGIFRKQLAVTVAKAEGTSVITVTEA